MTRRSLYFVIVATFGLAVSACNGPTPSASSSFFVESHLTIKVVTDVGDPVPGATVRVDRDIGLGYVLTWVRTTNAVGASVVIDQYPVGFGFYPITITVTPPAESGLAVKVQADSMHYQPPPASPYIAHVVLQE